jgi:hypothetical protein
MSHRVIVLGNIALLTFGIVQYLIFQAIPILGRNPIVLVVLSWTQLE